MLIKVISGGQTGADQAGLEAARICGIETGGWAPKGFKTSGGHARGLLESYGLKEARGGYKARTWTNVRDSDGTIRLAVDFSSRGEKCTANAIHSFQRPWFDVNLPVFFNQEFFVVDWIKCHKIKVLNVAGNTQRGSFDVYSAVKDFLISVFKEVNKCQDLT